MISTRRTVVKQAISVPIVAAASFAPSITRSQGKNNSYVLVHGGYHGGWCWSRVTPFLHQSGHRVFAPTITGVGERSHLLSSSLRLDTAITDITQVIEAEELTDIILVGHSIGGLYIAGVADRIPKRIRRLVFLDSVLVKNGQTLLSFLPPERQEVLRAAVAKAGGIAAPKPTSAKLFGLDQVNDIQWVERRMTDHPWSTWTDPLTLNNPFGAGLPKTYIKCTKPEFPLVAAAKVELRNNPDGWDIASLETGHEAMVTAPAELAQLLISLG